MTNSQDAAFPVFTEHRVPRDRGSLYVRDFPGAGPAFVLLHGFPDNAQIYDDLIPHLVRAGRRTVAIDFLGFGASDKPEGAQYSFKQQLGDLESVVEALGLDKILSPWDTMQAAGGRQLLPEASGSHSRPHLDECLLRRCSRTARS